MAQGDFHAISFERGLEQVSILVESHAIAAADDVDVSCHVLRVRWRNDYHEAVVGGSLKVVTLS